MRRRIRDLTANERFDIVQLEHLKLGDYVRAIAPTCDAIKVLTVQNIDHILYEQLARLEKNLVKKEIKRVESRRYNRFEKEILKFFNAFITVSEDNVRWLRGLGVQDPIHLSLNGADAAGIPFLNQPDCAVLMMPGSMDYEPNIDAAKYFVKEVLHMVWAAEMVAAILSLIRNPGKREDIARRARKHIEAHYDYKQIETDLDMFYRQLLANPIPLRHSEP